MIAPRLLFKPKPHDSTSLFALPRAAALNASLFAFHGSRLFIWRIENGWLMSG